MSRGVNKVILVGNLGHTPELRMIAGSNMAVSNNSLATSETWKDKNSGQQQERTEWHRIVFFGRQAEIICEYGQKGQQIYIEGALRTRKTTSKKTQTEISITEIIVDNLQLLGGARNQQSSGQHGIADSAPNFNDNTVPNNNASGYAPPLNNNDDFNDDIPF
jgi:single-strand DNA-binding protein